MSTALSAAKASPVHKRLPNLFTNEESDQSPDGARAEEDADSFAQSKQRSTLARCYTSLQDHADAVKIEGRRNTPRPEDRREGFMWASGYSEQEPRRFRGPRKLSFAETRTSGHQYETAHAGTDLAKAYIPPKRASIASFGSISSTGSSVSSIGPGKKRRAAPDLRIFDPFPASSHRNEEMTIERQLSPTKAGRKMSIKLPSILKRSETGEMTSKDVQMTDVLPPGPPDSSEKPKGTLKDRRNLGQDKAMKLTLPLDQPGLPARRRNPMSPMSHMVNLNDIAPPRSHSPKTPWVRDAPTWIPDTLLTPAEGFSDSDSNRHGKELLPRNEPIRSLVFPSSPGQPKNYQAVSPQPQSSQGRRAKSESSMARTPQILPQERTGEELKQQSKRPRRWRWSGPWTSGDLSPDSPTHQLSNKASSRSFLRNVFKRHCIDSPTTYPENGSSHRTNPYCRRRKQSLAYDRPPKKPDAIASMAVPPVFVPPGVQRVPTPLMYDEHGEVKGALANFSFDKENPLLGAPRPLPGAPGRIWDSDALLMSQKSNITPSDSSPSDEAPEGNPTATSATDVTPGAYLDYPSPSVTGHHLFVSPTTPNSPPTIASADWYRVQQPELAEAIRELQERSKHEWLTPEHLPNSPLCPLHVKYRGPCKEFCVFHGTRKDSVPQSSSGDGEGASSENQGGEERLGEWQRQNRSERLKSQSSP